MLNRTNRTLSANLNRLNLGTRMLGLNAGVNNGSLTLRTAPVYPTAAVRVEVLEHPAIQEQAPPIQAMPKPGKPAMSMILGSSPGMSSSARDLTARDQRSSAISTPPRPVVDVPPGVAEEFGSVRPLGLSSRSHPGSSLGWHCDRSRRAGRPARSADLTLIAGASPIT